jgi:hypothetical protein
LPGTLEVGVLVLLVVELTHSAARERKRSAMRYLTLLLALSLLLVDGSQLYGDWFYDFDDGAIPDGLIIESYDDSWVMPTDTLQVSADGGVLRMWDSTPTSSGGTKFAVGYNDGVFEGGVRVSAEFNPSGDTNDVLALAARVRDPDNQSYYHAFFNFDPSVWNYGRLFVVKELPNGQTPHVATSWEIPSRNPSYFVELEVLDDVITGFPNITSRIFDHTGETLLTQLSMIDTNLGGSAPVRSGTARVAVWSPENGYTVDSTFDNIRAEAIEPYLLGDMNLDGTVNGLDVDPFVEAVVGGAAQPAAPFVAAVLGGTAEPIPEPSTIFICLVGLVLIGGWQKWKRVA